MSPALDAVRGDVENLAALLNVLHRGAEDADVRRTLQLAARAAEAVAVRLEELFEDEAGHAAPAR